jgi:hypothetical protein
VECCWWCGGLVAALVFCGEVLRFDTECRRPTSPFKDREEPSGLPSSLSSSVLRDEVFHLLEDKDATSSIIVFYCCLDSWTVRYLQ